MTKEKKELTDKNFKKEVIDYKKLIMVDFYAPWCGPCENSRKIIEEIKDKYQKKIKIGRLNIDKNPKSQKKMGVKSIPQMVFYKNGREIDKLLGAHDKIAVIDKIEDLLE